MISRAWSTYVVLLALTLDTVADQVHALLMLIPCHCLNMDSQDALQDWRTWRTNHIAQYRGGLAPPPRNIVFYRDGVSEGEFAQVVEKEIPRIKGMCSCLSDLATLSDSV